MKQRVNILKGFEYFPYPLYILITGLVTHQSTDFNLFGINNIEYSWYSKMNHWRLHLDTTPR